MVTSTTATVTPLGEYPLTFVILVEIDPEKLWIEAPRDALFPHAGWVPSSFEMHVLDKGHYTFSNAIPLEGDDVFFGWMYTDKDSGFSCLAAQKPIPKCRLLQP